MATNAELLGDLNIIQTFSSMLYDLIYRLAEAEECGSWIELFTRASSAEGSAYEEKIDSVLKDLELTRDDLRQIQDLRKTRNALCHPRAPLAVAQIAVYARWRQHPAFSALTKMFSILRARSANEEKNVVEKK